jgi:hypothetical protein
MMSSNTIIGINDITNFESGQYVNIRGKSIGKGFSETVKKASRITAKSGLPLAPPSSYSPSCCLIRTDGLCPHHCGGLSPVIHRPTELDQVPRDPLAHPHSAPTLADPGHALGRRNLPESKAK